MPILNIIEEKYLNQKTLIKNIIFEVCIRFIKAVIGWNFNVLYFMPYYIPF